MLSLLLLILLFIPILLLISRARAEMPGRVSALPARAWGMYAPELRANSDELPLTVTDGRR